MKAHVAFLFSFESSYHNQVLCVENLCFYGSSRSILKIQMKEGFYGFCIMGKRIFSGLILVFFSVRATAVSSLFWCFNERTGRTSPENWEIRDLLEANDSYSHLYRWNFNSLFLLRICGNCIRKSDLQSLV